VSGGAPFAAPGAEQHGSASGAQAAARRYENSAAAIPGMKAGILGGFSDADVADGDLEFACDADDAPPLAVPSSLVTTMPEIVTAW